MKCKKEAPYMFEVVIPSLGFHRAVSHLCGSCIQDLSNMIYSAKLEGMNRITGEFGVDRDESIHISRNEGESGVCGTRLLRTVSFDVDFDTVCSKCQEIVLNESSGLR